MDLLGVGVSWMVVVAIETDVPNVSELDGEQENSTLMEHEQWVPEQTDQDHEEDEQHALHVAMQGWVPYSVRAGRLPLEVEERASLDPGPAQTEVFHHRRCQHDLYPYAENYLSLPAAFDPFDLWVTEQARYPLLRWWYASSASRDWPSSSPFAHQLALEYPSCEQGLCLSFPEPKESCPNHDCVDSGLASAIILHR